MGRAVASHEGFSYSAALQELGGDWTYEALNHFIESPNRYAPGTAMSFRGLGAEDQRFDLIAYLRSLSSDPVPLPDPLPEVSEMAEEVSDMAEESADAMGDTADATGEAAAAVQTEGEAGDATAEEVPADGEVTPEETGAGSDEEPQDGGH